jgi:hypothetical protein
MVWFSITNMTRCAIAKWVVLGDTYSKSVQRYENSLMFGGLKNPCLPLVYFKYRNIMLIQRRELSDSFQMNAEYFDDLANAERRKPLTSTSEAAYGYYRTRSQLFKECVYRMSR